MATCLEATPGTCNFLKVIGTADYPDITTQNAAIRRYLSQGFVVVLRDRPRSRITFTLNSLKDDLLLHPEQMLEAHGGSLLLLSTTSLSN